MNQIGDLLNDKAKDLFDDDTALTFDEPKKEQEEVLAVENTEEKKDVDTPAEKSDEFEATKTETTESSVPNVQKLKAMIHGMKDQLDAMLRVLNSQGASPAPSAESGASVLETGEQIIEGVFTGDKMLGQDGKEYNVPPNYASKSKLVEGDIMKLTITNGGKFIYKQIKPAEHIRVTGELVAGENGNWTVVADGKPYRVLTASVTFYKGNPGDDVVMLIPKDGDGSWGAVEHIIHT